MGAPVELSKDMIVTVTRADGTALASGDTYVAGEVLKIGLPVDIPGVFEAMGGDFVKGACGARRILPDANGFAGRWGREGVGLAKDRGLEVLDTVLDTRQDRSSSTHSFLLPSFPPSLPPSLSPSLPP